MSVAEVHEPVGAGTAAPVLELVNGSVRYGGSGTPAISNVSLALRPGEILGLVGESGCGKSTTARAMLGLAPLTSGRVLLHGTEVVTNDKRLTKDKRLRAAVQAIFQNPAASFNPKRSLLDSVAEPLRVHGTNSAAERRRRALAELDRVGITAAMASRRPHEVSGGQCQRAAIARATILRPEVLVCDEPVSALDVSIQAQILELLSELRSENRLAMLFISHDLGVIAALCDRTAVMYAGKIVEQADALELVHAPRHPYSVILQDSAPSLDISAEPVTRLPSRSSPDVVDGRQLAGCGFAALCPSADDLCHTTHPPLAPLSQAHDTACHHPYTPEPAPAEGSSRPAAD
ncbi:ABC transporter ATP-binding protein [Streptomyces blattellae]|uniref:ABC transporter ATP-binding protein n=1 Tax=Streptomyces blattellae TaxID=2569855 RepID=UPI0018ACA3E7|nr:ABC transporter ATP-binding protein [Streptomyces blattellae]